jgi:cell division protein ZapA
VKSAPGGVTISILGKELMVACPDDERESLAAAARYLDQRMREIQDSGKVIGAERCAVMAALNLTNELLQLRQQASDVPAGIDARLQALHGRIEAVLKE